MRKQSKIVLWPVYFDSTKTREERRKIPKNLAVPSPKIEDVRKAAERLGLQPDVVSDASHPSFPWQKTGMLSITKKGSKTQTLRRVAKELLSTREKTLR